MSGCGITRGFDVEEVDLGLVQRGVLLLDARGRTLRRIVEWGMPRGRRKVGIEVFEAIL